MAISRNTHCIRLRIRRNRQFNVVALAVLFFIGDVNVRDVVGCSVGAEVFVQLIDGFDRFCVLQRGKDFWQAALCRAIIHDSHVWLQAENRMHSARGLIAWLLTGASS